MCVAQGLCMFSWGSHDIAEKRSTYTYIMYIVQYRYIRYIFSNFYENLKSFYICDISRLTVYVFL